MRLRAIDLCCGAGGWACAAQVDTGRAILKAIVRHAHAHLETETQHAESIA